MGSKGARSEVHLYTHYKGSMAPLALQRALSQSRQRWDEPDVIASQVHLEMLQLLDVPAAASVGYLGIASNGAPLPDHPVLVASCDASGGRVEAEPTVLTVGRQRHLGPWTFDAYVSLTLGDDPWETLAPSVGTGESSSRGVSVSVDELRATVSRVVPATAEEIAAELSSLGMPLSVRALPLVLAQAGFVVSDENGRRVFRLP